MVACVVNLCQQCGSHFTIAAFVNPPLVNYSKCEEAASFLKAQGYKTRIMYILRPVARQKAVDTQPLLLRLY